MLEKIITSKIRVKLLKLFLTHIDDRYYLRELERMLNESLSPLRRQLIRLQKMGILMTEEEGNLKYYRLNKGFEEIERLKNLILGNGPVQPAPKQTVSIPQIQVQPLTVQPVAAKRIKYDVIILTIVAFFVLLTSSFVVYTSTKNIRELSNLASEKAEEKPRLFSDQKAVTTRPDEMVSRRWKVLPGNYPALSSGETGGKKRSKEL